MSDMNFTIQSGESKRFLTGGKYNPNDIVVTAEGGGGGSNGIELIETITLTEDTSSIVREFMPDGTPYAFKTVFAMIGKKQDWDNKWIKATAHYDNALCGAKPYVDVEYGDVKYIAGHRAFSMSGNNNLGIHIGVLETSGVILHLFGFGATNPGYHNNAMASIASNITYNVNNAKIIKFVLESQEPLVAGTQIYLFGVRA